MFLFAFLLQEIFPLFIFHCVVCPPVLFFLLFLLLIKNSFINFFALFIVCVLSNSILQPQNLLFVASFIIVTYSVRFYSLYLSVDFVLIILVFCFSSLIRFCIFTTFSYSFPFLLTYNHLTKNIFSSSTSHWFVSFFIFCLSILY